MSMILPSVKGYLVKRPSILVAALGLIALIVIGLAVLIGIHRDPTVYVSTVSPVIITLLGLFIVSRQVDDVRETAQEVRDNTEAVKDATNGKLDARFSEVHKAIQEVKDRIGD